MSAAGEDPPANDRPVVPAPPPAPFLKAAALMLLSTVFFGLMAIVIRVASNRGLPTAEIAFFRNVFGLLALLPFLRAGGAAVLRTRQLPRYLLRSAIGVASMLCSFWAIGHLPMAQAISLSYSTPLFVTIAAEQFGTNLRSTVATTVPNFVRGAVVPITLSFKLCKDMFGIIPGALIVGGVCIAISLWALSGLAETHGKDLDYLEPV